MSVDEHGGPPTPLDDQLEAIAVLQEPLRRSLYLHVAGRVEEVSRDDAARAMGIRRQLAAFHLDKLVEAGLLDVSFRRLTGRSGPGAGRPAKLYRRSSREHQVSLPPRQYELAAELLARTVESASRRSGRASAGEVARRYGRQLGQERSAHLARQAGREKRLTTLEKLLEDHGYEPRREGRSLVPANCPFHVLAERHRELVCGMNLSFLEGMLAGMGITHLEAHPDPRPGQCCVTVSATRRY